MKFNMSDVLLAGKILAECSHYFSPRYKAVERDTVRDYKSSYEIFYNGGEFPVCTLNSDNTIYPSSEDNVKFRAWHDMMHFITESPFSPEGEPIVYRAQRKQLAQWYYSKYSDNIIFSKVNLALESETIGQVFYEQQNGKFPEDQVDFCLYWMNR